MSPKEPKFERKRNSEVVTSLHTKEIEKRSRVHLNNAMHMPIASTGLPTGKETLPNESVSSDQQENIGDSLRLLKRRDQ